MKRYRLKKIFCLHNWEYIRFIAPPAKAESARRLMFIKHCNKCKKIKEVGMFEYYKKLHKDQNDERSVASKADSSTDDGKQKT